MIIRSIAIAAFALMTTVAVTALPGSPAARPEVDLPSGHAGLCSGEPCDAVARGLLTFLDRRLTGLGANGRSCADCHMPTSHFQLSPADVEFRYQLLQLVRVFAPHADDPLFRPIDADDFRINGEQAQDFSNLRNNGLVRIEFPAAAQCQADRSGDEPAVGRSLRRRLAQRAVGAERGAQRAGHQQPLAA